MQKDSSKPDLTSSFLLRLASALLIVAILLNFIWHPIGVWLGIILAAWFIGTQRPGRGLLILALVDFIPRVLSHWNQLSLDPSAYLAWMAAATILGVCPYFLHRLIRPLLPGIVATLPLPLWGVVCQAVGQAVLPTSIFNLISLSNTQVGNTPILQLGAQVGTPGIVFLMYWFAALFNWMWDYDFHLVKIVKGAVLAGIVFGVALGYGVTAQQSGRVLPVALPTDSGFVWGCLLAGIILSGWALSRGKQQRTSWQDQPEIVAMLRSPVTGDPLRVVAEGGQEILVSQSGERFPIRNGIPTLLRPEDLTGSNKKYNQLYEIIGGFYDSTQNFFGSLLYDGVDQVFLSYLRFLEIKPGDSVLETSVGTGLNYKYLPRGVKLFGLDLSPEMLVNCQSNLRRWELEAELFHGNAERLPFQDNSFDVVYHVGGINFFNDKARAICEMIRAAKPGSQILIADELEKHVKDSYERMPFVGNYFKNRPEAVSAPIDLIPPDMQDVQQETVWDGRFYVLVFRKPL